MGTNGHGTSFSGAAQTGDRPAIIEKLNPNRAHSFMFHYRVSDAVMLGTAVTQHSRSGKTLKLRGTNEPITGHLKSRETLRKTSGIRRHSGPASRPTD
jgi:hypothetical protein